MVPYHAGFFHAHIRPLNKRHACRFPGRFCPSLAFRPSERPPGRLDPSERQDGPFLHESRPFGNVRSIPHNRPTLTLPLHHIPYNPHP